MKAESFEYAIKKDVRNNPIVRELDNERHREMWRSLMIGVFVVVALVFFAWRRLEVVRHGYESGEFEELLAAQYRENEELRLEYDTLRSPQQIEHRAKRQLGMGLPPPEDYDVITLVISSPSPGTSVIARR